MACNCMREVVEGKARDHIPSAVNMHPDWTVSYTTLCQLMLVFTMVIDRSMQ